MLSSFLRRRADGESLVFQSFDPYLRGRHFPLASRVGAAAIPMISHLSNPLPAVINGRRVMISSPPPLRFGRERMWFGPVDRVRIFRHLVPSKVPPLINLKFSTENERIEGPICFKRMEEENLSSAIALVRFLKGNSCPRVSVSLENEVTGFRSCFVITKDEKGRPLFKCLDVQNVSKEAREAHLDFLSHKLLNPDEFLSFAYHKTGTEMNHWARAVTGKGSRARNKQKELLASSPFGRKKAIDSVLLCVDAAKTGGWLTSHHLDIQCYLSDLETLLLFFKKNLDPKDPYYQKVCRALYLFGKERVKADFIQYAFDSISRDLKKANNNFSLATRDRLKHLLKGIKILWHHRDEINGIEGREARRAKVNEFGLGDEGGVIDHATPKEITFQFIKTYQRVKRAKAFYLFDGLSARPCLTGLMRVINDATAHFEGITPEENLISAFVRRFPSSVLSAAFYVFQQMDARMNPDNYVARPNEDSADQVKKYLNSRRLDYFLEHEKLKVIIDQFKVNSAQPAIIDELSVFINFLRAHGIIPPEDPVDWDQAVPAFIKSRYFEVFKSEAVGAFWP